jgi:hypothetical protein
MREAPRRLTYYLQQFRWVVVGFKMSSPIAPFGMSHRICKATPSAAITIYIFAIITSLAFFLDFT